jgi:hypothetical protein
MCIVAFPAFPLIASPLRRNSLRILRSHDPRRSVLLTGPTNLRSEHIKSKTRKRQKLAVISIVLHTFLAPPQDVYIHTLKFTVVPRFAGALGKNLTVFILQLCVPLSCTASRPIVHPAFKIDCCSYGSSEIQGDFWRLCLDMAFRL